MRIIDSRETTHPEPVMRGVAMGFFDGMHRGHQQVVRTMAYLSAERGLRSCIYTFDVHPSSVISGRENPEGFLCEGEERMQCLSESGTEEIYLQHFDRALADMDDTSFLDNVLIDTLHAKLVVIGYDFRFGKNRSGSADSLRAWAATREVEVVVVEAFSLEGTIASSTLVRRLVAQGNMEEASVFLGRDYRLTGTVEPGRQLGARLGFPTANISIKEGKVLPATGVYATRTIVDGFAYESVTNIGTRPTVDQSDTRMVVETFLFDMDGDLYGKRIHVEFLKRLREEQRFDGLLRLSAQIREDISDARQWHAGNERLWKTATVNRIPIWVLRSIRFRTSILGVTFRMPIDARRATVWNLLSRILISCCRRFPTRQSLSLALDRLYGARIDASVDKEGDLLCMHFTADAVSSWIDGTRVFDETATLLLDMLTDPLFDSDGLFDAALVESERTGYLSELRGRWNDREKYTYDQGVAWYLEGTPHGVDTDGALELVSLVSAEELRDAYHTLLASASVTVVAGGDIGIVERQWLANRMASLPSSQRALPPMPGVSPAPCPLAPTMRTKREHRPMEQARLLAVFSGLPPYFSGDGMVMNVMNSMFGGDAHSLLFESVREKQSLAYSVFSSMLRYVGGVAVYAGVAPRDVEQAMETISEQMDLLASGRFESALFDNAVTMVRTQLLTLSDSLAGLLGFYAAGLTNGRLFQLSDALRLLADVTPAHISKLAMPLRLSSLFVVDPDMQGEGLK